MAQQLGTANTMYVDKQTVVKWQINCAIRSILAGECAVSTHVIVQAAREVMHDYARVKRIRLTHDLSKVVKPEYVSKAAALFKEHYTFLKHAKRDADDEIDITNIQIFNEAETMMNISKYAQLFNDTTHHMRAFHLYMMMRQPDLFAIDQMPFPNELKSLLRHIIQTNTIKLRLELCNDGNMLLHADPQATQERDEIRAISLAEETKGKGPFRDITKAPYFRRRKRSSPGAR